MEAGMLLWIFLIASGFFFFFYKRIMQKRIAEEGIQTEGVISRIEEDLDIDSYNNDYFWYAEYYDETGTKQEAMLYNPDTELEVGDKVIIKYHHKNRNYAEFVERI